MSAGRLVLLRHGRTAWNDTGRLQGRSDVPLDDVGQRQAVAAAATLRDPAPALVLSSDLRRAHDTARVLAHASGAPLRTDPRLRERDFGAWEGLTGDRIAATWPDAYAAWRRGDEPVEMAAEARAAVGHRVAAAVTDAVGCVADGGTLVVVGHGGALSTAMAALLGMTPGEWFGVYAMGNGRWSVLEPNPRREPAWRLRRHDVAPDAGAACSDLATG
ncbi:histidine phosphatase family protein [Cellulomonas sp. ATA003]|uniref:histidine phosphatase family protein n=1 Tax=Cellulomonas sp. ATA003 TaxID=3073064 RepID=UPI0028731E82|nr:histidine phosphatase family protein [Cellulomonas sp. ATA003]WNB85878.1 histidine phosphatase family protein [Cellulomonas sp. ATA003]